MFRYAGGIISYLFLTPAFINILVPYSFGNIHDISWGNRPDDPAG
jgi:cellulose synthase/poly-beta-1,6-N-acetylglucosamine synthase-like glycosyltransferase